MAVSTAFGAKTEGTEVVQKFSSFIKGKTSEFSPWESRGDGIEGFLPLPESSGGKKKRRSAKVFINLQSSSPVLGPTD